MQTRKVTLDIDKKTFELANSYAGEKGLSLKKMFEYYFKWIVWNETFIKTPNIIENITTTTKEKTINHLFNSWQGDESAEELIENIKKSRVFNREIIEF